jgi:hypothetical protein
LFGLRSQETSMRAVSFVAAAVTLFCVSVSPARALAADPSAGRTPIVTVVDSPLAEKWLDYAGVPFARRSGQSLGAAPIGGAKILVLPLQSVTTPAAVANVREFVAGGGKLVAVYWGTLSSDGAATNPAYDLTPLLGARPIGWSDAAGALSLSNGGNGVLPYVGGQVSFTSTPTVVVEPLPGALPVGRWVGEEAAALPQGYVGAVYLRSSSIFIAADLLRPNNDRAEMREVLFWAMQRVAPEVGPVLQAKERIATAAIAVGALGPLLGNAPPEASAAMGAAQAAMAEARAQLAKGLAGRAAVAADRARRIAVDLADKLKRERRDPAPD